MRTLKLLAVGTFGVGLYVVGGCSVTTEPSNIICTPDQVDLCTDCQRDDPSDTRIYRGRHTCAHDGKSFGACGECAPITDDATTDFKPIDPGPTTTQPAANIDAKCADKIGILAGKNDPTDTFLYEVVLKSDGFKAVSGNGVPMRSSGSTAVTGNTVMAAYRSKDNRIVTLRFSDGAWSGPEGLAVTSTDAEPSLVPWGPKLKAIYHDTDGHYRAGNYDPASGWATAVETIGADVPSGGSGPSGATVGAPGANGSAILFGYTDNTGGLYRQEWRGTAWLSKSFKSTAQASSFRPTMITMTSGKYDLIAVWTDKDGVLQASTRTVKENGSTWSLPEKVTGTTLTPMDAPNGIGLADGRAMLVLRDKSQKAWFTLFEPISSKWSDPAELVPESPALASTPDLALDTCGAEAIAAYAEDKGKVGLLRFAHAWTGPYVIPGLANMTYVTVAATP